MAPDDLGPTDGFRRYEELGQPDGRQLWYVVADETPGTFRKWTLQDHHAAVAEYELGAGVPDDIRIHFDTARNLLVHAWYVYRFTQVAEAHALASLEMALKERLDAEDERLTLRGLLKRALDEGLIRDAGFRNAWRHGIHQEPVRARLSDTAPHEPPSEEETKYVRILLDALPNYRNELAHGSPMLAPGGFVVLGICRDLIEQLFLAFNPDGR